MADPFTLALLSTGATALGGVVAAGGALSEGESARNMYQYQAGVAQLNKRIDEQNAAYTREAGGTAVLQAGRKTGFNVASQKVAQSGSGVDVNSGSSLGVRTSTTQLGQSDQDLIATNYARKAYAFDVSAATKDAESGADMIAASNAENAGRIKATASILGAAGSVSSKWLQGSSVFGGPTTSAGSSQSLDSIVYGALNKSTTYG